MGNQSIELERFSKISLPYCTAFSADEGFCSDADCRMQGKGGQAEGCRERGARAVACGAEARQDMTLQEFAVVYEEEKRIFAPISVLREAGKAAK